MREPGIPTGDGQVDKWWGDISHGIPHGIVCEFGQWTGRRSSIQRGNGWPDGGSERRDGVAFVMYNRSYVNMPSQGLSVRNKNERWGFRCLPASYPGHDSGSHRAGYRINTLFPAHPSSHSALTGRTQNRAV